MNQPVTILRPSLPPSEVEPKLLGAVMDLPDQLALFEGCGLDTVDFQDRRVSLAWNIGRRLAERRREVNALTIFSAGKAARVMDDSAFAWMQQLQATNTLTREGFLQIAEDLRKGVRGRLIASQVEPLLHQLRSGNYNPARIASEFEAAQFSLSGEDLRDETADSDLMELADSWNHHENTNTRAIDPTTIKVLDDVIAGFDWKLNVIFGLPGTGKNALIGAIIRGQLEADITSHTGLFGLEDGSQWATKRFVAKDLGMPVRDVGSKARTVEQREQFESTIAPALHPLLQRLHVYRRDEINLRDWLHVATHWVRKCKVKRIYLDNLGQMDHGMGGSFKQDDLKRGVALTVKAFARFAIRHQVPVIMLAHSTRAADDGERPPKMSEIQDSAFVERRARKIIGVWTKNKALRATIIKDQEGDGAGTTLELERFASAALVDIDSGKSVDLRQEAREDRKEKDAERTARALDLQEQRNKLKADRAAKAAAAAPPPKPEEPQQALFPEKEDPRG